VVWIERRGVARQLLVPELADRLDERQRFDVADGAADLDDQEVEVGLEVGRMNSLIALVTWGTTWTVAPR
jgi:hypothetical protein